MWCFFYPIQTCIVNNSVKSHVYHDSCLVSYSLLLVIFRFLSCSLLRSDISDIFSLLWVDPPWPWDAMRRPWVRCPAAVHSFASTGSGENMEVGVMGVTPAIHFCGGTWKPTRDSPLKDIERETPTWPNSTSMCFCFLVVIDVTPMPQYSPRNE